MLVNWFIIEIGEESAIIPQQPVSIDDESNQQFTNDVRYSADNSIDANCSNNGDNNVVMQDVVSAVGLFKTAQFLLCVCFCACLCVPVYLCTRAHARVRVSIEYLFTNQNVLLYCCAFVHYSIQFCLIVSNSHFTRTLIFIIISL